MNQKCPACGTIYRIDPRKIPDSGVRAQCATCPQVFMVSLPADGGSSLEIPRAEEPTPLSEESDTREEMAVGGGGTMEDEESREWEGTGDAGKTPSGDAPLPPPPFGSSDPHQRAKRLARALVSDIVVYHPDRRARSLRQGTVRQEFREEIRKSWDEYAGQVGNEFARETSYFREALNEILAEGAQLF